MTLPIVAPRLRIERRTTSIAISKICSSFSDSNIGVILALLKNRLKIEGLQRQQQMALDGTASNRYIVGRLRSDA
jgi:hypothetical protein